MHVRRTGSQYAEHYLHSRANDRHGNSISIMRRPSPPALHYGLRRALNQSFDHAHPTPMIRSPDSGRPTCPLCLRPQRTCICQWIAPVEHTVEVLILQHPLETGNAKGSARLLHLSLPHSRLVIGEVFAEPALHALLHAPFDDSDGSDGRDARAARQPVLLYPETPDQGAMGMAARCATDESLLCEPARLRLVVLDGTWRKSRKMLYLNPLLQTLPRLALRNAPASQYRIRKAHAPDQLSTLEAACHALTQLEQGRRNFDSVLKAFDGFVRQQSGYDPTHGARE
jgi:DTW domain-containing protein YfiP